MNYVAIAGGLLLGSAAAFADTAHPELPSSLQAPVGEMQRLELIETDALARRQLDKLSVARTADKVAQDLEVRIAASLDAHLERRLENARAVERPDV